jgi:hypothetical protein
MVGSIRGRLAKPLHKSLARIRWMGCWIAMYDPPVPRESGTKDRKVPFPRRGKNRRGCRSHRGGRKRRALAGDAPVPPGNPTVSKLGKSGASKRRFEHKMHYSATLIKYFVSLSKKRETIKEKLQKLSNNGSTNLEIVAKRLEGCGSTMKRLRRSWIDLAKTSGDSHEFIMIRFRVLVLGIDEFSKAERSKLGTQARIRLEADWLGELVPEVRRPTSKDKERPADAVFECTKCNRVTNINICRRCGSDLSRPGRLNDRRTRSLAPRGNSSQLGNRSSQPGRKAPVRPPPRR